MEKGQFEIDPGEENYIKYGDRQDRYNMEITKFSSVQY